MDDITNNNGYHSLLKATWITCGLKVKDRGTHNAWTPGGPGK